MDQRWDFPWDSFQPPNKDKLYCLWPLEIYTVDPRAWDPTVPQSTRLRVGKPPFTHLWDGGYLAPLFPRAKTGAPCAEKGVAGVSQR